MKRRFVRFFALVLAAVGVLSMQPQPAMAALGGKSCGAPTFLGFRPWYAGLCNAEGEIASPTNKTDKGKERDELRVFIWIIVLNITFDLTLAVGYIAVGLVIYGGYLYIMSQGDPTRAAKGKKTLTSAVIGTVIALSASVLVNTGRVILGINASGDWNQGGFTKGDIKNIFTWAYTVAGIVAVAFIIRGGVEYMISQGDVSRVQKATRSIIFAVVGLVIVLFAAAITAFISGSVGENL